MGKSRGCLFSESSSCSHWTHHSPTTTTSTESGVRDDFQWISYKAWSASRESSTPPHFFVFVQKFQVFAFTRIFFTVGIHSGAIFDYNNSIEFIQSGFQSDKLTYTHRRMRGERGEQQRERKLTNTRAKVTRQNVYKMPLNSWICSLQQSTIGEQRIERRLSLIRIHNFKSEWAWVRHPTWNTFFKSRQCNFPTSFALDSQGLQLFFYSNSYLHSFISHWIVSSEQRTLNPTARLDSARKALSVINLKAIK